MVLEKVETKRQLIFFSKRPWMNYAHREFVELKSGTNNNSNISLKRFHHPCYLKLRGCMLPSPVKTMALQGRNNS